MLVVLRVAGRAGSKQTAASQAQLAVKAAAPRASLARVAAVPALVAVTQAVPVPVERAPAAQGARQRLVPAAAAALLTAQHSKSNTAFSLRRRAFVARARPTNVAPLRRCPQLAVAARSWSTPRVNPRPLPNRSTKPSKTVNVTAGRFATSPAFPTPALVVLRRPWAPVTCSSARRPTLASPTKRPLADIAETKPKMAMNGAWRAPSRRTGAAMCHCSAPEQEPC